MLTSVVLVRHGESIANANRLIGGPRTCQGLSGLGRAQVEALGRRLKSTGELDGAVLMSSHYPRAIETGRIIGEAIGLPEPITDEGWGELDPGPTADGWTFDQYVERFGQPVWPPDPDVSIFPDGESVGELSRRVVATLERVVAEHVGRVIAVATHGGVVDQVIRHVTGAPAVGGFDLWTINSSLTGVSRWSTDQWRLDRYNDASHLSELGTV
jgi:probable phosphoglycerate mutase